MSDDVLYGPDGLPLNHDDTCRLVDALRAKLARKDEALKGAREIIEDFLSPTSHTRPSEFKAKLRAWLAAHPVEEQS